MIGKNCSRTLCTATAAVLACGIALTLWLNHRASASLTPAAAVTAAIGAGVDTPYCVFGFSKDACEGFLKGDVKEYSCSRNGVDCKTVVLRGAKFEFDIRRNTDSCSGPFGTGGQCDETAALDGRIFIKGDFTFRKSPGCPWRGCWSGEFKLVTADGTVASGTAGGTLGTGSHRSPTCITPDAGSCPEDCEKCYDVQFSPSGGLNGTWFVGLEGCLNGAIIAGDFVSSDLCVTVSGMLRTPGTVFEPANPGEWKFCGTTDGVVLAKCELH